VGEVNAAADLVAALRAAGHEVTVSTTTDTGQTRARSLFPDAVPVVRYPLDFSGAVRRFLDAVRPDAVALMELELWPNFLEGCACRGVPVCVVNGRLSGRSFRRLRQPPLRRVARGLFRGLAAIGAQTRDDAERFACLGAAPQRIAVTDTMKWDTAPSGERPEGTDALARALGLDPSRPFVVAGSTGPGEEALLLREPPAGAQVLLAPRRPERFEEVAALAPQAVRRTACPDGTQRVPGDEDRFFLLDTMGELEKAYALADVALVGRSFLGQHGSNPLEPVALGKPTLIGPHHEDFAKVVAALRDAGGLEVTAEPARRAEAMLADPETARGLAERGRTEIARRRGATRRNAALVKRQLELARSPM
jgi:3-deoxy-D-manno-octulosonic-acid transferase